MWRPEIEQALEPPYLAIVGALNTDIGAGRLRWGDRLPTHRELADTLHVAIGTVSRAYKEAERRGLVRGEVGRGTFVGGSGPSPMSSLLEPVAHESAVIDLSCNYPVYGEGPDLADTLRRLSQKCDLRHLLRYQPHAGLLRHRTAGADWASRYGINTAADSVLVCNGAQHALAVVLSAIAEPGDLVVTEGLTYPGMKVLANMLRLKLMGLPMDENGLMPGGFESVCRKRRVRALYLMPTIQNPTGTTLPEARRRRIARIAAEYDVAIVEDDVHRLLAEDPPPPLQTLAPERTYFVAGLSKAVTGGLRIGYLIAPPHAVERLIQSLWATCWMVAPLTAEIATVWIEDGTADQVLARKRDEARARQDMARHLLNGLSYRTSPHSFHLWLRLPGEWDGASFAVEARRRGVAITPADAFAVGKTFVSNEVRVCLGAAEDRNQLEKGLNLLVSTLACAPGTCPALM